MIRNPDEILDRARRIMQALRMIMAIELQSSYARPFGWEYSRGPRSRCTGRCPIYSVRNAQRWRLFHALHEELERTLA